MLEEGIEKADLQARQWKEALKEFGVEMSKQDVPFCMKCAKLTYDKDGMIDEKVATDLKEIDTKELFHKKTGKNIGVMIDYICQMGHGVSEERKTARKKKKKDAEGNES